jgi:hypothetical protein
MTESDLGAVESFQAEPVLSDRSRLDLEGTDSEGRPLLVVEAKFGARLDSGQVQAYLTHQKGKLGVDVRGALILLVPADRKPEAADVLRNVGDRAEEQEVRTAPVSTAVITWDEWMGVWGEAARELPADERKPVL